ncbi:3-keto-steroid reductase/17-beta-hydroxysteroid dehydrogenase 7-like [Corticium candelabrum]|uniref:3-keto-steroid reductase/17-beta-hydroxysteroid dehydrogenase 7-like n=1 Tax=Corticium candelabrum TaxID=121492 RepID=UPI002E25E9DA|nr:3-keto-steroid reductase/17-beta-hydroxysteroid dehydrogenase 7-like [Corticium candelabrum]
MSDKTAIITGANSGLGLAVAKRLFEEAGHAYQLTDLRVCLACRNLQKAKFAKQELHEIFGLDIQVDVLELDVSRPASVKQAVEEIKCRYKHIDWLYLNAGIMPVEGVNWSELWPPYPSRILQAFTDGGSLLKVVDSKTPEGLNSVFATNLFGHFLLVRWLEDFLCSQRCPAHIVWTSSSTAMKSHFNIEDVQDQEGIDPYGSSKFGMDLLSLALNNMLNDKGIYSHTVSPGLVITNMTTNILAKWLWYLMSPVVLLMRLINGSWTWDAHHGAEAQIWLSKQDPAILDHTAKYYSCCSPFGKSYVKQSREKLDPELADQLYKKLLKLAQQFETS